VKPDKRDEAEDVTRLHVDTATPPTAYELPDMTGVLAAAHANGNDPLLKEMIVNHQWEPGSSRAPVMPSLIARAWLYDAVMLHKDPSFKRRFDGVFGRGAADQVLAGG
jgi:hypothetical protein